VSVSVILAGAVWPEAAAVQALSARIAAACPGAELIEARESRQAPRGAAAIIDDAIRRASGDVVLVLEPWSPLDAAALRALADAGARGLAIEAASSVAALAWPPSSPREDMLGELAAAVASGDDSTAAGRTLPMPGWAIRKATFVDVGGFDPVLWHVGLLEDLAARLPASAIVPVPGGTDVHRPAAWPIEPTLRLFLQRRNAILTAFRSLPAERLGGELVRVAVGALRAATVASGLTGDQFRFGGGWGAAEGALARLLRPGADGASYLADHVGTLAPLLALDSALHELPRLLATRQPGPEPAAEPGPEPGPAPAAEPASQAPAALQELPTASVIIVSWNGKDHLGPCLASLAASDYPAHRLEIIVVDNGSADGTVAWIASEHPRVRVVALASNQGFTGGNAAGVAVATGAVLLFFNNDMRVEPDAVRRLVTAAAGGATCAAARVLSWDGREIDFLRGTISFEARGFQDYYGEPVTLDRTRAADTFFPNGGAFAVTREAYDRAGGFDDAFFAYYDDVDLGWRLRLVGLEMRVEDAAIVYHRHGATSRTQPAGQKRFLMERNALWTLLKNYGEATLRRTLGPVLLLATRRLLDEARLDERAPALARFAPFSRRVAGTATFEALYASGPEIPSPPAATADRVILGLPAESLAAIGAVIATLPETAAARRRIQAARCVGERDVLPHFGRAFEAISSFASYRPIQEALVDALDLPRVFTPRARLLIVSHEAIATNMSGPAVRFLEIGRALSHVARVTLAMPGQPTVRDARVTIAGFDPVNPSSLRRLAEDADVIFVQGFALVQYPFLGGLLVPIIVDLYCPFTIEHLEQTRGTAALGDEAVANDAAGFLGVLNGQIDQGDFFICASEAQRDFWIGNLHSRGRINPRTYAADPTLRRLIDVVPFGLPDEDFDRAAAALPPVMKGVRPGIAATDTVLLWGGSLLDWQDPVTLIEAVAQLAPRRPELKLLFMGTKHPNPMVKPMRAVAASRERAAALGVLDRHVFFNDWVPYAERARYLAEADLGVSTHREHLETHFSFRTRMLDYVWARLPIVCTDGDVFAQLVRSEGLGATVPPGDAAALAQAIDRLLGDPAARAAARTALARVGREMQWSRVVAPLARFLETPASAADHAVGLARVRATLQGSYRLSKWLKRTALRIGMTERRVEQLKRTAVVRGLMQVRNRVALARAMRRAR
jgi:GT2 family glycosyltransferase/glycosyltransferase involved in cell wall biosynthesis